MLCPIPLVIDVPDIKFDDKKCIVDVVSAISEFLKLLFFQYLNLNSL